MAALLRRQWMDNEQLRFPLTTLPLAIIRDEVEGQPFFSNRLMWAGFAFAATVFGVNGLSANFPDWPKFTLDLWLRPDVYRAPVERHGQHRGLHFLSRHRLRFLFCRPTCCFLCGFSFC